MDETGITDSRYILYLVKIALIAVVFELVTYGVSIVMVRFESNMQHERSTRERRELHEQIEYLNKHIASMNRDRTQLRVYIEEMKDERRNIRESVESSAVAK